MVDFEPMNGELSTHMYIYAHALLFLQGVSANCRVKFLSSLQDGTKVRLMEDAATLERSRRELWYYNHHRRPIRLRNGDEKAVDEEYVCCCDVKISGSSGFHVMA